MNEILEQTYDFAEIDGIGVSSGPIRKWVWLLEPYSYVTISIMKAR